MKSIEKQILTQAPEICKDFEDLGQRLTKLCADKPGQQFAVMVHQIPNSQKKSGYDAYLVFAPLDSNQQPMNSSAFGFEVPCPPFCDQTDVVV